MTKYPPLAYQILAAQSPQHFASARRHVTKAFECLLAELRCKQVDPRSVENSARRTRVIESCKKMMHEFKKELGNHIAQERILQADAVFKGMLLQKVMQYTNSSSQISSKGGVGNGDIMSEIQIYATAVRCLSGDKNYSQQLFSTAELFAT